MRWAAVATPIGTFGVAVDDEGVCELRFAGPAGPVREDLDDPLLTSATTQVTEYFAGTRTVFDLPLHVRSGSEFERAVWRAMMAIPYGRTRSYGQIARDVGEPGWAQAVGTACHRNPLPLVVPCHRVIGADGKLVGFGGGIKTKQWLLQLETKVSIEQQLDLI